jgi:hypothetical protein
MKKLVLGFYISLWGLHVAVAADMQLHKNKGFVGYVQAGTTIEIKTVNMESQTLNVIDPENKEVGVLQVTFKNFERSLGGNKKVEFLNKSNALVGKTMTLKHNLVLLPL